MKRKTSIPTVPSRFILCRLVLMVLVLLAPLTQAAAVDLSPASWPAGDLDKYSELTYDYDRPHPSGVARKGLIAGATTALAVRAGLEALKQGGTAAAAAVTAAMVQIVLTAGWSAPHRTNTTAGPGVLRAVLLVSRDQRGLVPGGCITGLEPIGEDTAARQTKGG